MINIFKVFDKNRNNRAKFTDIIFRVLKIQELFTDIQNVNYPEGVGPCLYAIWHGQQFCVHGLPDRANCNILVSRSRDGQIIAGVLEKWGFKSIKGSKGKKGSVEASMQMIHALQNGECCVMMVDGPRGPGKVVKEGVIRIAKKAGVPIVPVYWYSPNPNFLKFPSWDEFRLPLFWTKLINIYGEPIYVNPEEDKEQDEQTRLRLQHSLEELEELAPKAYKEVFRFGLWRK